MKNVKLMLTLVLLSLGFNSFSQSDFFAGKWDMLIKETPNGDAKMTAVLTRADGKLTGELLPVDGGDAIQITSIEEEANAITISFTAQGYDLSVKLTKEDDNNLKGMLMDMFVTTLARKVDSDFFAGQWKATVYGTPQGDAEMIMDLHRENGKLKGTLKAKDQYETTPIDNLEEKPESIKIFFKMSGYDLNVELKKDDNNNLSGKMMDMFDTKAVRK